MCSFRGFALLFIYRFLSINSATTHQPATSASCHLCPAQALLSAGIKFPGPLVGMFLVFGILCAVGDK